MADSLDYRNKRVLVSGCFSGIGHSTAQLLIEQGAEVHGLDCRFPNLKLASFASTDLRDAAAIDQAVNIIGAPLHALFNCAGLAPTQAPLDVLKVNFIGTRHLSCRAMDYMPAGGAIVSVSSNGGAGWRHRLAELQEFLDAASFDDAVLWCEQHRLPLSDAYRFSKEALVLWTMLQSAHSIRRGIRLNCTSPGCVQTPMLDEIEKAVPASAIDKVAQPIGRRSQPHEQAWPLLILNSDLSSYINGVDLPVDGGFAAAQTITAMGAQAVSRHDTVG